MKVPHTKVRIIEEQERPVERNVMASAILNISQAVQRLSTNGLTFDGIVILTQHNCRSTSKYGTKPGLADVRAVLRSLGELEKQYLAPKKKP